MEKKIFICLRFLLVFAIFSIVGSAVLPPVGTMLGAGFGVYCSLFVKPIRRFVFGIKKDDGASNDQEGRFF